MINKYVMNVLYHMILFTIHFALKKEFRDLSLAKHFATGYWIFSYIFYPIEGGNQQIVKYFMEKSGVCFVGSHTPLTFNIVVLAGRGVLSDFCWVLSGRFIDLFYNFG